MATTFDPFLKAVELAIESARLDRDRVMSALPQLRAAHASGDPKALNYALRELTPAEVWSWPSYEEWFAVTKQKRNTRLKMVEALTSLIYSRCTLAEQHKQALEGRARNPLWEFRAVGDSKDWPDCRSRSGFQAAWDDPRWRNEMLAPFFCRRVGCRCSIRTRPQNKIATTPPQGAPSMGMSATHAELMDRFYDHHLGENWKSTARPVFLSGWQVVEALWPMNDVFRPRYQMIHSLRYDPNNESGADQSIAEFVMGGTWSDESPLPGVWRVLSERHSQAMTVALANEAAGNDQVVMIPDSLPARLQLQASMLFLMFEMKLVLPPQDAQHLEWPEGPPPASLRRH